MINKAFFLIAVCCSASSWSAAREITSCRPAEEPQVPSSLYFLHNPKGIRAHANANVDVLDTKHIMWRLMVANKLKFVGLKRNRIYIDRKDVFATDISTLVSVDSTKDKGMRFLAVTKDSTGSSTAIDLFPELLRSAESLEDARTRCADMPKPALIIDLLAVLNYCGSSDTK